MDGRLLTAILQMWFVLLFLHSSEHTSPRSSLECSAAQFREGLSRGSPGGWEECKGSLGSKAEKVLWGESWVSLSSHYESLSNFSSVFWERHLYYFVTARCVRWKLAIYLSESPVNVTTWHCEVPGSETQDLDVAGKIWRKIFQLRAVVWFKVKNMVFQVKKDSSSTFCHLPIAWSWVCKLPFILSWFFSSAIRNDKPTSQSLCFHRVLN